LFSWLHYCTDDLGELAFSLNLFLRVYEGLMG
jgi:hypothetical protein